VFEWLSEHGCVCFKAVSDSVQLVPAGGVAVLIALWCSAGIDAVPRGSCIKACLCQHLQTHVIQQQCILSGLVGKTCVWLRIAARCTAQAVLLGTRQKLQGP